MSTRMYPDDGGLKPQVRKIEETLSVFDVMVGWFQARADAKYLESPRVGFEGITPDYVLRSATVLERT